MSSNDDVFYDKMSSVMDNLDFSDWLQKEIDERGWTQADLARAARVNRQVINTYINRQRMKPDEDILQSIARAFGYPDEFVFRAAGLLPQLPDRRTAAQEILGHKAAELSETQLDELIAYIDFIQSRDERLTDRRTDYRKETREGAAPPETLKK